MKIDDYDFENTAKAVYVMNDSARDQYESWEELREFMISMAYAYMHKSTCFSTGGFNLTSYIGSDGEVNVRASVSAYVAMLYVTKMTADKKESE